MKKNIAKECDFIIMLSIFLIALLYGTQLFLIKFTDINLIRLNQLVNSIEFLILSGGILWKAYRLGSCVFTRIAVWMYITMVIISIVYLICPFGYNIMLNIGVIIFIIGATVLLITYLIRIWIGSKSLTLSSVLSSVAAYLQSLRLGFIGVLKKQKLKNLK